MTLFFFWGKVGRISFCSSESLHLEILLPWHLPLCPSVGSLGVRFSMAPNTVLCIKQSNFSNFFIFGGIQFIIALSVFPRIPFCVLSGLLLLAQHCGQLKPYFEILDHCALCEHIFTIACFFFSLGNSKVSKTSSMYCFPLAQSRFKHQFSLASKTFPTSKLMG